MRGDAQGGRGLRLSRARGLAQFDVLSTYAIFLGRRRHMAAVPPTAMTAAEMASDAEAVGIAARRASQDPTTAPSQPSSASPAAVMFSPPRSGSGGVPAVMPTDADGEDLVGCTSTAASFELLGTPPFDIVYSEYRPGRKTQPFRKHTRQDAQCPLCHLDEGSVPALLDHFHSLHTDINVELCRAESATEVGEPSTSSGECRGWDCYLVNIRWVPIPAFLAGVRGFIRRRTPSNGALCSTSCLPPLEHSHQRRFRSEQGQNVTKFDRFG